MSQNCWIGSPVDKALITVKDLIVSSLCCFKLRGRPNPRDYCMDLIAPLMIATDPREHN